MNELKVVYECDLRSITLFVKDYNKRFEVFFNRESRDDKLMFKFSFNEHFLFKDRHHLYISKNIKAQNGPSFEGFFCEYTTYSGKKLPLLEDIKSRHKLLNKRGRKDGDKKPIPLEICCIETSYMNDEMIFQEINPPLEKVTKEEVKKSWKDFFFWI